MGNNKNNQLAMKIREFTRNTKKSLHDKRKNLQKVQSQLLKQEK